MAEKHGGTKYGPYLDDIADFVSFGLAPAYVVIKSGGMYAWAFAAVFVAVLVLPPNLLSMIALLSTGFMVSHIRFAHFGRIILKRIPKPLFFMISAAIVVIIAFILKTKNAEIFGYLILGSVMLYMLAGRKWVPDRKA